MAKRKGQGKSGHKSLRISSRLQFGVELWASLEKKTETALIESAIEAHLLSLARRDKFRWESLFHPVEGVRKLRLYLLRDPDDEDPKPLPLDDMDEVRRVFVMQHRPFFYDQKGKHLEPLEVNAEILWPEIDRYQALTAKDYWSAGRAMAKALTERGIDPPHWPPTK